MQGKLYLLITSLIIIAGALSGLFIDLVTHYFPTYWHVPRVAGLGICIVLLITGVLGIVNREKSSVACMILGNILGIISLCSIPVMFWVGHGSAPMSQLICAFVGVIVFGIYLFGVTLNRGRRIREYHHI